MYKRQERESQGSQTREPQGSQTRAPIDEGFDDPVLEGTELPAGQRGQQLQFDYDRPRNRNPFSDPVPSTPPSPDQSWRDNRSRPSGKLIVPYVEIPANQSTSNGNGPQVDPGAFESSQYGNSQIENSQFESSQFESNQYENDQGVSPAANSVASVQTTEYSFTQLPQLEGREIPEGKEIPTFIPPFGMMHGFEIFPSMPASYEYANEAAAPNRGAADPPSETPKQPPMIRLRAVPEKTVTGK